MGWGQGVRLRSDGDPHLGTKAQHIAVYTHLTDEKTKIQRGWICPMPYTQQIGKYRSEDKTRFYS